MIVGEWLRRLATGAAGGLRSTRVLRALAGSLLLAPLLVLGAQVAPDEWDDVERIVAIGDIHGDYDNYIAVLKEAGIINRRGKWIGGKTHFVQVGDVPDRGPDTDRIIEHLKKLEAQAKKAGGRVHALIGNHEAMNISGDLRYVHPGEYAALKTRRSGQLLENYYQRLVEYLSTRPEPPVIDDAFREQWFASHPPGFVEHRQYWHPEGEFGAWASDHNTVIRINRMLFLHAGLGPSVATMSIREINERVREELKNPRIEGEKISQLEDGPLWYRGLAAPDNPEEAVHLQALLEHFDVDHIVIGHTPGFATVVPHYDTRVLAIDSGLSAHYGGYRASLLIDGEDLYTVQKGEVVPIPDTNAELLPYFQRIAELQPGVKNLDVLINWLQNPTPPATDDDPVDDSSTEGSVEQSG